MDIGTRIAVYGLITATLTLIFAPMSIPAKRLIFFAQVWMSVITTYGILCFFAWLNGEIIYIWGPNDFDIAHLNLFCQQMLIKALFITGFVWAFFYIGLRVIFHVLFYKRLRKYFVNYLEQARNDIENQVYSRILNALLIGVKIERFLMPIRKSAKSTESKEERDIEINNTLIRTLNGMAMAVHAIVCAFILNVPYKIVWAFVVIVIIGLMIIIPPYMKAIFDHFDGLETESVG